MRRVRLHVKRTLARSRRSLTLASVLIFVGALAGLFAPVLTTETAVKSPSVSFFFRHNIRAVAFFWSGVVTCGLSTIFATFFNGFAISRNLDGSNIPITLRLALFVPHAVFELPALCVAGSAGFRAPIKGLDYLRGRCETPVDRDTVTDTLILFVCSVAFVGLAAIVEAYVTPWVTTIVAH